MTMNNELDKIIAALKGGDKAKNEELIRSFLTTPAGKQIADSLKNMSGQDIERLISSAPQGIVRDMLSEPEKLRDVLNDPAALDKIKRKLG